MDKQFCMKYTLWKFCFIIAGLKIQKNYYVFKLWQPCSTCNIIKYIVKLQIRRKRHCSRLFLPFFEKVMDGIEKIENSDGSYTKLTCSPANMNCVSFNG